MLKLSGTCPLPDGVVLRFSVTQSGASVSGGRPASEERDAGGGTVLIEGRQFGMELYTAPGPRYTVIVWIPPDHQEKALVEEVRRKVLDGRAWRFKFEFSEGE